METTKMNGWNSEKRNPDLLGLSHIVTNEGEPSTSETEKEWLRRISKTFPRHELERQIHSQQRRKPMEKKTDRRHGFGDVAGMNELKEFVTDGFINVLRNRKCVKMYGIKPPSMLFYGPAGYGKTFFAEKMAEEIGINFMKIVPDDLACTWIHGTQQKIGEVFKDAEKKAPTLLFFDEFDAMMPKRSGDEANQHYDGEGMLTSETEDVEPRLVENIAKCRSYEAESGWYGLMTTDGKITTPPSYSIIKAIGYDMYLCKDNAEDGVILNGKGERVQ